MNYKRAGYVYTDGLDGYEKILSENTKTITVKNDNGNFIVSDEK